MHRFTNDPNNSVAQNIFYQFYNAIYRANSILKEIDSKSTAFDISDFAKSAGTLTTLQLSGADNGTPQLVHSKVLKQLTKVTTLQVSSTAKGAFFSPIMKNFMFVRFVIMILV